MRLTRITRPSTWLLICVLILLPWMTACESATPGRISIEGLDPILTPVLDRHDAYVVADESLTVEGSIEALGQSQIIRNRVDDAWAQGSTISAAVLSMDPFDVVLERHDTYVLGDQNAAPVEKSTWLRSTELIRAVVQEALPPPSPRNQ